MIAIGFILGFVGYLPLGNINLTVVQLAASGEGIRWQRFVLFAAFMEFVYCFGCLYGMERLMQQDQLIIFLNWSAVLIFLGLGMFSFFHNPEKQSQSFSGVKRGVLIAIFNPLQIPFWLIWGVYVFQNSWVKTEIWSIALFSFLCSLGTIAVLYMYAVAGKKLVEKLNVNALVLNRFIGVMLILLAVFQAVKSIS